MVTPAARINPMPHAGIDFGFRGLFLVRGGIALGLFHAGFENPPNQFVKTHAGLPCRHGHQTVVCHTRHGIDFDQPGLEISVYHEVVPEYLQ